MYTKILSVGAFALFLAACGGASTSSEASKSAEMSERIRAMEDSIFQSMNFDRRSAQALLDVYKAYAATFPLDTLAPEYLFRAAGVAKNMRDPDQSLFLYDRIINDYPGWRRIADAYYLKAFTLDSEMDRKGEAKAAYQKVINMFPEHAFAKDARAMIENLEYTDEELIEKFRMMEEQAEAGAE